MNKPFITNDKEKRIQNPVSSVPKDYWGWKEPETLTDNRYQYTPPTVADEPLSVEERQAIKRQMLQKMMTDSGSAASPNEVEAEQYSPEQKQMIKELGWQMNQMGSPIIPEADIKSINEGIKVYQQGLPIDRRTEMILRVMTDIYDEPKKIKSEPITSEDISL